MYIVYWQPFPPMGYEDQSSGFRIETRKNRVRSVGIFPSESQWMVPGTVDPNE